MVQGFSIEPFKSRKHDFRADKGKTHNYPKTRKRWNPKRICQRKTRKSKTNLSKYDTEALSINGATMSRKRKFKGTPSMREYWREQKRKQREKDKKKVNLP